ncbi:MAG: hypothetical protein ACI9WC_002699, partial [Arenicella sp.]
AGQSVYAIGSVTELGSWSPNNAIKLEVAGYPSWSKAIQITEGQSVSWKCLKRNESDPSQGIEWQSGSDNSFNADANKTTTGAF